MITKFLNFLLAPGLFQSPQVAHALILGSVVAITSAIVGVFAVIRGQAFAGHALADFGATGASGAFLLGINTLWGFIGMGLLGGLGMDMLGRTPRERDVTTGITLSFMLGLGSLFLYYVTTKTTATGAPMTIFFGSIFLVNPSIVSIVIILELVTLLLLVILYRPLLLSSINPDLAYTRGVPLRTVSLLFMSALVLTVEQSALVTGALLSTVLLIGPAAIAIRLTKRLGTTLLLSVFVGLVTMWLSIVLAYDSAQLPPVGRGWPVSFFVVSIILLFYSVIYSFTTKGSK
ncbi:metal ABC transporter permease [Sulfoacidibacillus thermotolerans]|uniref:metal ABC transporter permease n=1 Tax=Sulfoacidibacillus thermotolerans TaxID=1765684 RepID=UPI0015E8157A|nr:metal ABC transporter permease [Sulfoacidibacillus thermotolerans]